MRRQESPPYLEVPLTTAEEVPGDAVKPLEKRSREEEMAGMILLLSVYTSFERFFVFIRCFLFFWQRMMIL